MSRPTRAREPHPSDLTDAGWTVLEPPISVERLSDSALGCKPIGASSPAASAKPELLRLRPLGCIKILLRQHSQDCF